MTELGPVFDAARDAYEQAVAESVTLEQLQALDSDGRASVLFYLTGRLRDSQEFQDALAGAYAAELRIRARVAHK